MTRAAGQYARVAEPPAPADAVANQNEVRFDALDGIRGVVAVWIAVGHFFTYWVRAVCISLPCCVLHFVRDAHFLGH